MPDVVLGVGGGGEKVKLNEAQQQQGLYVIGETNTGKTNLLVSLATQHIQQGLGVCFIDPRGEAIIKIIPRIPEERLADVILLDPLDTTYPFGLNLYECADPTDPFVVAQAGKQLMSLFENLWGPGSRNPSWEQY